MKRKIKTVTAFIIAMFFCMNSVVIASAEGETSGACGDGVTWGYDEAAKTLTIEGSGAIDDYTRDSEPWYSLKSNIKTVVINSGVTRIGNNAFYNCALTSVSVPDTVTSIGQDAFFSSSLQSIDIPSSVKTIEYGAFRDSSLKTVTFNEGLESIGAAAFNASKVSSMSAIPKSVKSIGVNAFVAMGSASTGRIDSVYLLSTDCALPTESGSYNDIFYNSFKQPTVYFVYSEATEEYLNRVEHTNYVILCLDGTENHTYEKASTTATCTSDGTASYECSLCGMPKEEAEPALGHSFTNYVSDGNATCIADGTKTAECDNGCGETDTVTDEGTMTAHIYEPSVIDATCTAQGYTEYKCKSCGESYKSDYTDALGHTPETVVVKDAKIGEAGLKREVCTVCGAVLSETKIPALTEKTTEQTVTQKPDEQTDEEEETVKTDYSLFRVVGGIECAKAAVAFDKNLSGYEVLVSENGSSFKRIGDIKNRNKNYLIISNLKSNKNYSFKIRGYKKIKGKTVYAENESREAQIRIN